MALAALARSPHRPYTSGGLVAITGNATIQTGFDKSRPIRSVSVQVVGSAAPTAIQSTFADNGDGTITVYLWKATATADTTLIAATVATNVLVRVEVD